MNEEKTEGEIIIQKLKEMDSALSLIVSEIGFIKEKVSSLEESIGLTSGSLEDMINNSIGNLNNLFDDDSHSTIEELGIKKDELNSIRDALKSLTNFT